MSASPSSASRLLLWWCRACVFCGYWVLTRPRSALPGVHEGADCLLVGFALVRGLLMSAKHLFLAAKQWQFVPASGVRWSRVSAAKG